MFDCFAFLDEPRRPWLDSDKLKQKFLVLSSTVHPDKIQSSASTEKAEATGRFANLNAAYQCLSDPKARLLHLLELERGTKPTDIQQIPPTLADVFAEVAMTCRSADQFLAEKSKVTSPLLQVELFGRGMEWTDKLNALQQRLANLQATLMSELKSLDQAWEQAGSTPGTLSKAEELYRLFGYFNRWNRQIQERIVALAI